MTMHPFNFEVVDSSWHVCLQKALNKIDTNYLQKLIESEEWLPGPEKIFNAFSIPLTKVNYVLFGESPYPRQESANGYAFWDAAVKEIWSPTGLSKKVNRATSLRNIIKMLLVAEGYLPKNNVGQEEIAKIDKPSLVQTNEEFFNNLLAQGFLLLNASLVLQPTSPTKDARAWLPFIEQIIEDLIQINPHVKFIILGSVARPIKEFITHTALETLFAEHPYNHSFITNPNILDFFKPLHLLKKTDLKN